MARYRIRWRDIFRNWFAVQTSIMTIMEDWKDAKGQLSAAAPDPQTPAGRVVVAVETLASIAIRRKGRR